MQLISFSFYRLSFYFHFLSRYNAYFRNNKSQGIYNNNIEYRKNKCLLHEHYYSIFKNVDKRSIRSAGSSTSQCATSWPKASPPPHEQTGKWGGAGFPHFEGKPQPFYVGRGAFRSSTPYSFITIQHFWLSLRTAGHPLPPKAVFT